MISEKNILILKKNIIKAKDLGYKYIIVTYEGSGDSGSVEDIYMCNIVPDGPWGYDRNDKREDVDGKDREIIEQWAYDEALYNVSDWYNDEGGYGTIAIDVNDATYKIENSVRVMSIDTEYSEGKGIMAHPLVHAKSSVRKFGGKEEDYILIHEWFDETKSWLGHSAHRCFRHHSEGIFEMEKQFGSMLINSDGKKVYTRYVGEQHVKEDCNGYIPSAKEWINAFHEEIKPKWMLKTIKLQD